MATKPKCKLVGLDGNVFNLIGAVSKALRKAGLPEEAKKFQAEVMHSSCYGEALSTTMKYIEVE